MPPAERKEAGGGAAGEAAGEATSEAASEVASEAAGPCGRCGAIFVYYRVPRAQVEKLPAAFAMVVANPLPLPGVRGVELMRRAGDDDGATSQPEALQTWMEIYRFEPWLDPDATTLEVSERATGLERLQQAIEARAREAGIVDLVEGERHYEAFVSCA